MKQEILNTIKKFAIEFGFDEAVLRAFVEIESGGKGFDEKTGKLIIQFEPHVFKKYAPNVAAGA